MKITVEQLIRKGLDKKGQQFFVFRWLELVHKFSIDSYRFRAMNSKSILQELIEAIDYAAKNMWDRDNVKRICEEAAKLISTDKVLPAYPFYIVLQDVLNVIQNSAQYTLKSFISGVLKSLEASYFDKLMSGLKEAIESNDLHNIDWYTSTLVTELINSGYDRAYLENIFKATMVNPQEKSFDEKFSHFTRVIKPRTSIYKTYLKLKTDSINFPPGLKLRKTNEINFPATEKHIKDYIKSGKLYFESEIEALDPYSAAIVAKSKFGTTLDLIRISHSSKDKLKGALRYFRLGLEGFLDSSRVCCKDWREAYEYY